MGLVGCLQPSCAVLTYLRAWDTAAPTEAQRRAFALALATSCVRSKVELSSPRRANSQSSQPAPNYSPFEARVSVCLPRVQLSARRGLPLRSCVIADRWT